MDAFVKTAAWAHAKTDGPAGGRDAEILLHPRYRSAAMHAHGDAAEELIAGLTAPLAFISPKYFYDSTGSRLFEEITGLPEYYPTRTERAILSQFGPEIARSIGMRSTLIDLGAGNCEKARSLFPVLQPSHFVAVDVAEEFVARALDAMQPAFPDIRMIAVCADLASEIALPESVPRRERLFFYPGSSIGNFMPDDALSLLRRIRAQCGGDGGLLIGVDLVKPVAILDAAYNDARGVTATFNLNILDHVNALIGSDFAAENWKHVAFFNAAMARIEMHLEARQGVAARWPGGSRMFRAGERIHTEYSYKYDVPAFAELLRRAGFSRVREWTDAERWFAVFHAVA